MALEVDELLALDPGQIVGRRARLAMHPEVVGSISGVYIDGSNRKYTFRWYANDAMQSADLWGWELELV